MDFLSQHPKPVTQAFLIIFSLLVLGGLYVLIQRKTNPDKDLGDVPPRLKTWFYIVSFLFIALAVEDHIALWFFGFISFLAIKEFYSMISTRRADRRMLFWAYLSLPVQYYWVHIGWYEVFIIFIPVYMFLLLPVRLVLVGETEGFLRSVSTTQWGLMTCVFGFSHLAYLGRLSGDISGPAGGSGLIMFLLILTEGNDVAQYVWGKSLGRHKIIPKISPNKTTEGFLGGLLTTMVMAYLLGPIFTGFSLAQPLMAGFLIATCGFFGDLVMSAIKRDMQVKDTGTFLPGHGGVLDRIDSLLYTAPLFFHFTYYIMP